MSQAERIVVVGAGLAGLRSAERLRELGFSGELVIIGAEALPPYHRPALSKQLLSGAMRPNDLMLPAYQEIGAKWRLGTTARSLSPNNRVLRLPGGEELGYDGLIIATGVEARRPNNVPYHDKRVMVMRTLPDALALERAIAANRGPVAVVGGGFTGCEIASSLRHMGREVTIIGRSPTLLGNVLGNKLGDWLTNLHRDHGVDLALDTSVTGWQPSPDGIGLYLSDSTSLLAACVVIAAGTTPSTGWLRGSGLPLDNGVVCEATCHVVGADDVVAAGDVAQWPNIRFDAVPRRIEHWLNAVEMGRAAAESLWAGRSAALPFTPMPRFWTEQYGVRIQAAGVPKLGTDTITLGTPDDGTGTVMGYVRAGKLMGVVGLDCPSSVLTWTDTIRAQNPSPTDPAPTTSDPAPSLPRNRSRARHSLPPKPKRTRSKIPGPIDSTPNLPPLTAPRLSPAPNTTAHPLPANPTRLGPAASNSRLHPAEPNSFGPAASSSRLHPAEPNRFGPAASSSRLHPAEPSRFGPAASSSRLHPAEPTGFGPTASNSRLHPAEPRLGPSDSSPRIPPTTSNGHALPADPSRLGPAASSSRLRPAEPSRFSPAGSSPRIPPTTSNGHALPADPGRFGPSASSPRLHPAEPRLGPSDSSTRIPPAPRNGRAHPSATNGRLGPAMTNGRIPPAGTNGHSQTNGHPGPVGTNGRILPAATNGHSQTNGHPGPVGTNGRIPPAPTNNGHSQTNGHHGPAGTNGRILPAATNGHAGPTMTNGRLRPLDNNGHSGPIAPNGHSGANGHHGPTGTNGRIPPAATNGHAGPARSSGHHGPAATNGRIPPASGNGHHQTNGYSAPHDHSARTNGHARPTPTNGHGGPTPTNGHGGPSSYNSHGGPSSSNGHARPAIPPNGHAASTNTNSSDRLRPMDINGRFGSVGWGRRVEDSGRFEAIVANAGEPATSLYPDINDRLAATDSSGRIPIVEPDDATGWVPVVRDTRAADVTGWIPRVD